MLTRQTVDVRHVMLTIDAHVLRVERTTERILTGRRTTRYTIDHHGQTVCASVKLADAWQAMRQAFGNVTARMAIERITETLPPTNGQVIAGELPFTTFDHERGEVF
jgi:hypothetical protein